MKIKKVTAKENKFCRRYLIDSNATKSAMTVGYSKRTARQIGYELLTKPHIQEHIAKLRADMEENFDVTRERLLQELSRIAFFDIRLIYNKDGSLKDMKDLDEDTAAAIAGIEVDELVEGYGSQKVKLGFIKKVKISDKVRAIDAIARMLGYSSTIKVSGTDDKGNPVKEFKVTLNI